MAYAAVDPDTGRRDVWIGDVTRRTQRPLARGDNNEWWPVWSPTGDAVAFQSGQARTGVTIIRKLTGTQDSDVQVDVPDAQPSGWSPDGRVLALNQEMAGRQSDVVLYDLKSKRTTPFATSPAIGRGAVFSPDGQRIAFASNETGRMEVYVRAINGTVAPLQLSARGGDEPRWSPKGQEVYYQSPAGLLMVAEASGTRGQPREPRGLIQTDPRASFAVAPDGDIFVQYAPDDRVHPNISIIVNWQQLLGRR